MIYKKELDCPKNTCGPKELWILTIIGETPVEFALAICPQKLVTGTWVGVSICEDAPSWHRIGIRHHTICSVIAMFGSHLLVPLWL